MNVTQLCLGKLKIRAKMYTVVQNNILYIISNIIYYWHLWLPSKLLLHCTCLIHFINQKLWFLNGSLDQYLFTLYNVYGNSKLLLIWDQWCLLLWNDENSLQFHDNRLAHSSSHWTFKFHFNKKLLNNWHDPLSFFCKGKFNGS